MKKHNEGYTLPLVMVVLLVLSIVAVTIMTTSLKNMQRQQSFIEQMQAQYAAQGEIEKIVAQLENLGETAVKIPLDNLTYKPDKNMLSGTITAVSGTGDSKATIMCSIEITATTIAPDPTANDSFKITGKPTITFTSYEIIKGGAAG